MKNFKKTCLQPVLLAMCLIAVCGSANAADNIVKVADKAGTCKTLLAAAQPPFSPMNSSQFRSSRPFRQKQIPCSKLIRTAV